MVNREKKAVAEVAAFNELHPSGTQFEYWTMARHGQPSGVARLSKPGASIMCGVAVAWLEGVAGCVALSHLRVTEGSE